MSNPFESASAKTLDEILREAEQRLEDQLTAGTAADQRAVTFAGLMATAVAAIITITAGLKGADRIATLAVGTGLSVAALAALWSARPTSWAFRGTSPTEWIGDIEKSQALITSKAEMAAHYGGGIGRNARAMTQAAGWMRVSLIVTGLTLSGALFWAWLRVA
jgi:hypothetical protein